MQMMGMHSPHAIRTTSSPSSLYPIQPVHQHIRNLVAPLACHPCHQTSGSSQKPEPHRLAGFDATSHPVRDYKKSANKSKFATSAKQLPTSTARIFYRPGPSHHGRRGQRSSLGATAFVRTCSHTNRIWNASSAC